MKAQRFSTPRSDFVAGVMAALVVDLLEAVEVDADQGQPALGFACQRHFEIEAFVVVGAVRQAGECVVHRQAAQPFDRIRPRVVIDQVADQPGPDDDEGHGRDGDGVRLQGFRVGKRAIHQQRLDAECGHAGEVQRDDRHGARRP